MSVGDKDSVKFFYYAKGSCGELRTQIYIGKEIGIILKEVDLKWKGKAEQISKMLSSFIKSRTV